LSREIKDLNILVTASVPEEAEGIRELLAPMRRLEIGGRPVYEGKAGRASVRVLVTGPGMVNTAQSLTAAVENMAPSIILMTGCAGGFAGAGMRVGDIGIATEENDIHLGIEPEDRDALPAPLPFDLEVIDGAPIGSRIPMDGNLVHGAADILREQMQDTINTISGPFVTVATITATDRGAARIHDRFQACMENMEGVAGSHVAMHYGIPFIEIRCASNLVGKRDLAAWDLPLACRRSAEAAMAWIRFHAGS
jgi:futalosine hydrolase